MNIQCLTCGRPVIPVGPGTDFCQCIILWSTALSSPTFSTNPFSVPDKEQGKVPKAFQDAFSGEELQL